MRLGCGSAGKCQSGGTQEGARGSEVEMFMMSRESQQHTPKCQPVRQPAEGECRLVPMRKAPGRLHNQTSPR